MSTEDPPEKNGLEPINRTALLLGASGLVGGACLSALLSTPEYSEIRLVTRRHLGEKVGHDRVREVIVDFDFLETFRDSLAADDVFCAFGTTMRRAGSRERFRRIDLEYPRCIAEMTRLNGARHFLLVSSKGASPASRSFYLRIKGELESALLEMDWPSLTILRPSMIGGEREESRPMERLGQRLLSFAPASIRTVPASGIALAMVRSALSRTEGTWIIESAEMLSISGGGS